MCVLYSFPLLFMWAAQITGRTPAAEAVEIGAELAGGILGCWLSELCELCSFASSFELGTKGCMPGAGKVSLWLHDAHLRCACGLCGERAPRLRKRRKSSPRCSLAAYLALGAGSDSTAMAPGQNRSLGSRLRKRPPSACPPQIGAAYTALTFSRHAKAPAQKDLLGSEVRRFAPISRPLCHMTMLRLGR